MVGLWFQGRVHCNTQILLIKHTLIGLQAMRTMFHDSFYGDTDNGLLMELNARIVAHHNSLFEDFSDSQVCVLIYGAPHVARLCGGKAVWPRETILILGYLCEMLMLVT